MFGLGLPELIIILVIVLLLFGTSRLPKISRHLGESGKALKDGFTGGKNDKSLKDIAKEVSSSAHEIKKGVDSVKNPGTYMNNQPPDNANNPKQDA